MSLYVETCKDLHTMTFERSSDGGRCVDAYGFGKFHFSEVHGSTNAMDPVQSK